MKILVVEDNKTIATSVQKGLETFGHVVDVAFDGETGYDLAANEEYNVIILDLMLPGMSGQNICEQLRKEDISTPILMLTARGELEDKVVGFELGADDYLVKPFEFAELVARVQALGRRAPHFVSEVISYKGLTVNTSTMQVERFGTPIQLSKREYALLVYLLQHQGTVVSKDSLLENVWEFDADVLPNTVEVYIGYLRTKLEKPFKNKGAIISTVRGFGYSVKEEGQA
ncbi:MAG: response regulator transcription factor [Pseudomonadales bacterium]|nr:response regulator transcription factor [Candidatus Woesebacteria bacterium]MCB9801297.1 response regulator transcription factor [Pseudomonadales bacterium]